MVCLLVTVGILCICTPVKVQASERHLTGDTEVSTVINPAGTATTPEEVGQLNTANTVSITYNNGNGQINGALRILITLTLIALAPTIIIMMTSFTRIIIVLHFTRSALNTQTAPPNQILIGLALILTFFIMEPTITRINEEAIQPLRRARSIRMRLWKRHGTLTGIYVSTDSGEGCGTVHGYRRTGVGRNPGGYSEFRVGSQLYDQ